LTKADWICAVTEHYVFWNAGRSFLSKELARQKDRPYVPFEQICGNTLRDDFFVGFNGIHKTVLHFRGNFEAHVK
jgi:hypothetical protein